VLKTGKYKVEVFDRQKNQYVGSVYGLGMHVDVKDPDDKTVLSRVSVCLSIVCAACLDDLNLVYQNFLWN